MTLRNFQTMAAVILALSPLHMQAQKYVGGDISLLTKNEAANATYLDHDGNTISDVLTFFKEEGMNAMRVRLFVDPSNYTGSDSGNVCQDLEYVTALGKRIKDAGFSFMLDFHYSDQWADPSDQYTPAAWASMSDSELYTQIYSYTKEVLQTLVAAGATPDFIQTGNEISYGMLYGPTGTSSSSLKKCYINSTDNWDRFTTLLTNASKACREVCPDAKIILHTERVAQTSVLANFYTQMANANVDYDIIGLSYYSAYHGALSQLESALTALESSFSGCKIMIVETGYGLLWALNDTSYDYTSTYPYSDTGQCNFTNDLITLLNNHSSVTGLFWWWMEYNPYPYATTQMSGWYNAPLFDPNTGKATSALSVLKNFLGTEEGISTPNSSPPGALSEQWYTIGGARLQGKPTRAGVYINGRKKAVVRQP